MKKQFSGFIRSKKMFLLLGIVLLFGLTHPASADLDERYARNGELYMLIGDGVNCGVYDLHNHSSRVPEHLYNPGKAYGIRVDLDRNIYSFIEDRDADWVPINGWVTVKDWVPGDGFIGHTHHYAHDTSGNCTCRWGWYRDVAGNVAKVWNGKWYHGRNLSGQNRCKKLTAKKIDHLFYKCRWSYGMGSPVKSPSTPVATSRETKQTYYIIRGCHDGCCPDQGNHEEPPETPITDGLISSFGRAYFYKRTVGRQDGTITVNGADYGGQIIGNQNDLSGLFLGVSAKTAESEWVYLLGDNVIFNWLRESNFPVTRSQVQINDVAVSDQWWQKGGIVYAYNAKNGNVYKFERDENTGTHLPPEEIPLVGTNPGDVDDIETDGFGNLYFAKTFRDPVKPQDYTDANIDRIEWNYVPDLGVAYGKLVYKQTVSKAAFQVDYYSGSRTPVRVGEKVLGSNTFSRRVVYAPWTGENLPTSSGGYAGLDKSKIQASGSAVPEIEQPTVEDNVRTEIAAINVATPPQVVGFKPGHVDIAGPYIYEGENRISVPYSDDFEYKENVIYSFEAENFPLFDGNGVNRRAQSLSNTSANQVVDMRAGCKGTGTGYTGGFCSTIIQESMKYYWKITMLEDRYGDTRNQIIFGANGNGIPSPILNLMLDKGKYRIELSIKYDFYDYDLLQYGSLAGNKEDVRFSNLNGGQLQWAQASGSGQKTSITFQVEESSGYQQAPPGRIFMLVRDSDGNVINEKYGGVEPTPVPVATGSNPDGSPQYGQPTFSEPIYVVPEDSTWTFKLREIDSWLDENGNWVNYEGSLSRNRVHLLTQPSPPDPGNPQIIPGTLGWHDEAGNPIHTEVKWNMRFEAPQDMPALDINEGDNMLPGFYPLSEVSVDRNDLSAFEVTFGDVPRNVANRRPKGDFDVPSDPYFYLLTCNVKRSYTYKAYMEFTFGTSTFRAEVPYTRFIKMKAIARIVVTDETPPHLVITDQNVIYGTTGDPLTAPGDPNGRDPLPPDDNPEEIEITVFDNNPFGRFDRTFTESPYYSTAGTGPKHDLSKWEGVYSHTVQKPDKILMDVPLGMEDGDVTPAGSDKDAAMSAYTRDVIFRDEAGTPVFSDPLTRRVDEGEFASECWALFTIPIDEIQDYSDESVHGARNVLPINREGFPAYTYSIRATDSSGNMAVHSLGSIYVRDNDRPNIFIMVESPRQGVSQVVPTNIKDDFIDLFSFVDNNTSWGGPPWLVVPEDSRSTLDVMQIVPPEGSAAEVTKVLYEDIRLKFRYFVVDNIARGSTGENITPMAAQDGHVVWKLLGVEDNPIDLETTSPFVEKIFREPKYPELGIGDYEFQLQVHDFATNWEGVPLTEDTAVGADRYNTRTLRIRVPIYDTTVRVHTIESRYSHDSQSDSLAPGVFSSPSSSGSSGEDSGEGASESAGEGTGEGAGESTGEGAGEGSEEGEE